MTEERARELLDLLEATGCFMSGFDCAAYCLDGYYGIQARKAGQPKSDRWGFSFTPVLEEQRVAARRALGPIRHELVHQIRNGTYYVTEWEPRAVAA